MDWLKDIIKDLAISKALIAAIFVTAVVMYFGPIFAPAHVPALPRDFLPYLFATMVLTGCLLALWGSVGLWHASRAGIQKTAETLTNPSLVDTEKAFLFLLAMNPSKPINLDDIDYSRAFGTKLEFHQLAKGLQRKGLVRINGWDDDLISLTEKGRERALEIQRQVKRTGEA